MISVILTHVAILIGLPYAAYKFGARKVKAIEAELKKIEQESVADVKAVIARVRAKL